LGRPGGDRAGAGREHVDALTDALAIQLDSHRHEILPRSTDLSKGLADEIVKVTRRAKDAAATV
jgi:hypothetical protein